MEWDCGLRSNEEGNFFLPSGTHIHIGGTSGYVKLFL